MWIKVNEVLGRENIINIDKVERITSDGNTGSWLWFGQNDADSMHIVESYEEVEGMIEYATGKVVPNAHTVEMMRKMPAMR